MAGTTSKRTLLAIVLIAMGGGAPLFADTTNRLAPRLIDPSEVSADKTLLGGTDLRFNGYIRASEIPARRSLKHGLNRPPLSFDTLPRPQPVARKGSGFLLPDSHRTRLSERDLKGYSALELKLALFEIYARHGLNFSDIAIAEHFWKQPWYKPKSGAIVLNRIEAANAELIRTLRQAMLIASN